MNDPEAVNRAIAEHLVELRERLAAGSDEIRRQQAAIAETREHLTGMRRWIEQTDIQLGQERARRAVPGDNSVDA